MKTIMITKYRSMTSFNVSIRDERGIERHISDANDAGEAAAIALMQASGKYVIVGPDAVMKNIPFEIRMK